MNTTYVNCAHCGLHRLPDLDKLAERTVEELTRAAVDQVKANLSKR